MSGYSPLEIAGALLDTGEVAAALDVLNDAIAASADDDLLRLRAGLLARLPGHGAQAARDLDAIAAPTVDDQRLRLRLLHTLGDAQQARAAAEQLWAAHHDGRDAETLLHLLARHFLPDAAPAALSLLDQLPDTWNWIIWRGDVLAASGQPDSARAQYVRALAQCDAPPDDPIRTYLTDRIASL